MRADLEEQWMLGGEQEESTEPALCADVCCASRRDLMAASGREGGGKFGWSEQTKSTLAALYLIIVVVAVVGVGRASGLDNWTGND